MSTGAGAGQHHLLLGEVDHGDPVDPEPEFSSQVKQPEEPTDVGETPGASSTDQEV